MCFRGTAESYGFLAKLFHWSMALIIIGVLIIGLSIEEFEGTPTFGTMIGLHKEFGVLVLFLAALRLGWKVLDISPSLPESMASSMKIAAKLGHGGLYALMFALPLSGWVVSSAGGHPVSFFGLFDLPALVAVNKGFAHDIKEMHELFANALMVILGLHVAAALLHHFYYKDDILRRMLPNCKSCKIGCGK